MFFQNVQVRAGVGPVEVEQPAEKLDFTQETTLPDEGGVVQGGVVSMESEVGTTAREGRRMGEDQSPIIRGVTEADASK